MATTTKNTTEQATEWIDEMTYEAGKHIELGKARAHKLRGYKEKTRAAKAWADKQGVKADRQEVQLKTERTKLQTDKEKDAIANTNLKGTQAEGVLNQISWTQKLTKKAYSVGVKPGTLGSSPVKVKLIKTESLAMCELKDKSNQKLGCIIVGVAN